MKRLSLYISKHFKPTYQMLQISNVSSTSKKKETKTLNKPNLISLTLQYHQGHLDPQLSSLPAQRYHIKNSTLKHSHPGISIHILHTVLSTFPMVLTKKFCLTINQELSNLVIVYYFYYSYDLYI